jgi:hypothetical protein
MFLDGYQVVPCDKDDFGETFSDCLLDVMTEKPLTPGCIVIPTSLNLRYSEKRGLGLTIGRFFITIPSLNSPPKKDEIVAEIKEVYEMIFNGADMPLKIGGIQETTIVPEREYGIEIEIIRLQ